jgi:hypothetical protein
MRCIYQFDSYLLVGFDVFPAVKHAECALADVLTELEFLADP